jgi:hypothetical protein
MRTCKVCGVEKEYVYLCLNGQGRAVYKDENGKIWHSRTCSDCFTSYVKSKAGKQPLKLINCLVCRKEFQQKAIKQKTCCKQCYQSQKISE